jgi:hypothetical protein
MTTQTVPLLDLAPKRKTPLSLWNPIDYLVLLYWAFFFPQAIRWYMKEYNIPEYTRMHFWDWSGFWQYLSEYTVMRNLFIQGLLITPLTGVSLACLFQIIGVPISWFYVLLGMALTLIAGIGISIVIDIKSCIVISITVGTIDAVFAGIVAQNTYPLGEIVYNASGAVVISMAFSEIINGAVRSNATIEDTLWSFGYEIYIGVFTIFANAILNSLWSGTDYAIDNLLVGIKVGFIFSIVGGGVILINHSQLLFFLLSWIIPKFTNQKIYRRYSFFAHTTWIPLPGLRNWLLDSLQANKAIGVKNVNHILDYSLQFIPVIQAINDWLVSQSSEDLYSRIETLVSNVLNWDIIYFGSADYQEYIMRRIGINNVIMGPSSWKEKTEQNIYNFLEIKIPHKAACAGYWLLHEKDTTAAMDAFACNRHIPHGETLYQSTRALDLGRNVENLASILAWETETVWLNHLVEEPLRPQAIATLRRLHDAAREAGVAAASISKLNRNAALGRSVATLTELLDDLDQTCPELERPIVREIAAKWRDTLAREAGKAGQVAITKPVENPFVVGNPVSGAVFVGREEIFRRLEELWGQSSGQVVPSVVLFGHRRMGKSSILQNLGERRFGLQTIVAQFTMQRAGRLSSIGELLGIFASKMQESLTLHGISLPEPDLDAFERAPYISFDRFLSAARSRLGGQRLILTIDEFELIEDAIQKGKVDAELLAYLRGVIHSEAWFVLALAGLHTLEEMTADYWNPLFSSVTPVRVSFLSWESTANLLANPHDDFPLDFTREAIDRVYVHVRGQPYLTQLIGHTLVRLYNQSVFEQQTPREPRFNAADVDEIVERSEFYEQGGYYFAGVWSQAQTGPAGQTALLRALAASNTPLAESDLLRASGLTPDPGRSALEVLTRHDIITFSETGYDFTVPLMRRWINERAQRT